MPDCIRKVSTFLGKTLNEDDINRLNNHLRIDNFRGAVRLPHDVKGLKNSKEQGFIRKGKMIGIHISFGSHIQNPFPYFPVIDLYGPIPSDNDWFLKSYQFILCLTFKIIFVFNLFLINEHVVETKKIYKGGKFRCGRLII